MFGDGYKHTLHYAIMDILDIEHSPLRFHELEKKIEKYCKIYPPTLARHLKILAGRNIVKRTLLKNGRAVYTLTKEFKDALEIQKKHYPTSYWKKIFSLRTFQADAFLDPQPEFRRRPKIYWPQREGEPPSWWLPSWRREFYNKKKEIIE